jgi:3-carboxy-cis,cis-muconate cycloisomerase
VVHVNADEGGLFESIFAGDRLLAATSDQAWLSAMLRFEAALAAAQAAAEVIPADAARQIVDGCEAATLDPVALGRTGRLDGNPVIPLVSELRGRLPAEAAGWLHFGATSQDVIDSALMLIAGDVLELVRSDLRRLASQAARLAERHRSTPMVARTLLQQAGPTTFGARAAGWLVAASEAADRVQQVGQQRLAVQLGGATGTLAALGAAGPAVVEALARELGLAVPVVPWHTDRTRVAELAAALGAAAGVAGKIGLDVSLLAQTEVGEVKEGAGEGHGRSSALPHKRNPARSVAVVADSRRAASLAGAVLAAMPQEHERAAGAWQSEWQTTTALFRAAGGAVDGAADVLSELEVDEAAMARNLDRTNGLILAERVTVELSRPLGYARARQVVEAAVVDARASGRSLADALPAEVRGQLPEDSLNPARQLGSAEALVDRALAFYRRTI